VGVLPALLPLVALDAPAVLLLPVLPLDAHLMAALLLVQVMAGWGLRYNKV
jgi:hypothetical protein